MTIRREVVEQGGPHDRRGHVASLTWLLLASFAHVVACAFDPADPAHALGSDQAGPAGDGDPAGSGVPGGVEAPA